MHNQARTKQVHIPKKDVVKFIIKEVLQGQRIMSQAQLAEIMNKKLKKGDQNYAISGERARLLATEIPEIRIHAQTRRGSIPEKCPCCECRLRKSYAKNLYGRKVTVKLSCLKCGYKGSDSKWAPKRYEFEYIK